MTITPKHSYLHGIDRGPAIVSFRSSRGRSKKPIIVIKAGRTEAAAKAIASHTGSLTGNDAVLDAAFRRVGVLRVKAIEDLFDMAEVLSKQPRPKGPRLAVVTNAGGPGVLATDMLVAKGGEIATLSEDSLQKTE
jgi:acetyltransferase